MLSRRGVSLFLVPALLAASQGCLSSSYTIRHEELTRLAQIPPTERWQAVRATQQLMGSDHPPADATYIPTGPTFYVGPTFYLSGGTGRTRSVPQAGRVYTGGRGGGGGSGGSGGGGGGGGGSGNFDARVLAVIVVAGAVLVFVLAGSEGARYDGWLAVHPHEMVYLRDATGTRAVPLSALTPELAASADEAHLYEGSRARFERISRAPLDRVGLTVSTGAVFGAVPGADGVGTALGAGGRFHFGGFFLQQVGVGVSADVITGSPNNSPAVLYGTAGPEVQIMPLTWVGAYGGVGGAWRGVGSATRSGWYARGGLVGELPITTRFSLQLRAGVSRVDLDDGGGPQVVGEASLGMAVY